MTKALDVQVGGNHYKKMKIQTMEFSMANGLNACQHTIIKYVCRYKDKGGIEDLRKARHVLEMLIEFEQKEVPEKTRVDYLTGNKPYTLSDYMAEREAVQENRLRRFDEAAKASTIGLNKHYADTR